MEAAPQLEHRYVLGMRVDATSYADAAWRIRTWADREESRYVCAAAVHMTMEAFDDPDFRCVANQADLVTPDGMPLVWALRVLGVGGATRVYGPELTLVVCEQAAEAGIPVGFLGGRPEVLRALVARVSERFPRLRIAYAFSPPFRSQTDDEEAKTVAEIKTSGARILFVGLGCPRQERWMSRHRDGVRAVMLGVGAAFDFISGAKPQAPRALRRMGLEWLFRLGTEPRRLFWRYAYHNPRFVVHFARQLLRGGAAASGRFPPGEARRSVPHGANRH